MDGSVSNDRSRSPRAAGAPRHPARVLGLWLALVLPAGLVAAPPAAASGHGFQREDAVLLEAAQNKVDAAVIDPSGVHGYFGTHSGHIVKVNLETFERIDAIKLAAGEHTVRSGVIDPLGDYAYFATATYPSRVVKIDLGTFTRVGAITLDPGEDAVLSAAISPAGDYAFFGTYTSPGQVVRIDLATFSRVDAVTLDPGENGLSAAVVDPAGDHAYFGLGGTFPALVVKIDLGTFARDSALILNPGENAITSAIVDPQGDYAYFGTHTSPGRVVKVDLDTFTRDGALIMSPGENFLTTAVIDPDGETAYFGTYTWPARVVKIDLKAFTRVGAVALDIDEFSLSAALIAPGGSHAYFGTDTSPGRVVKVHLDTFTRIDVVTFAGEDNVRSAVIDPNGDHAYFGTSNAPGKVVKVDLATFTSVDTLTVNTDEDALTSAVVDANGDYAYFGTDTSPGRVVKIELATFTQVGDAITLGPGEDFLASAVIDPNGTHAYFGTDTSPGRVVKVDLESFDRVGAVILSPGEDFLASAVVDPNGDHAYFGTDTSPGRVVRIDLATFASVGAVTLDTGENGLRSAVVDRFGDHAYFGTWTFPGRVVKVDLATFVRDTAVILDTGENRLVSATLDPNGDYAYFGTDTAPGRVVQVGLGTFARTGAVTLDPGENMLTSAVVEPSGDHGYFGTSTAPGRVVKVALDHLPPDAPTNPATTAGHAEVDLSWNASTTGGPVDDYLVEQSPDGVNWTTAATTAATAVTVTGLTNGDTYHFRVRAQGPGGVSAWAGPVSATPQHPPPDAPTNLAATAGDAEVDLSWNAPTTGGPVDDYLVEQSPDGVTWTTAATTAATAVTVTGLTNGDTYHFRVRAQGPGGVSAWAGPVSATPQTSTTPPAPVTGLKASAGNGQALLSWTPPGTLPVSGASAASWSAEEDAASAASRSAEEGGGPLDSYRVQQSTDGSSWTTVAVVTDAEVTITGLENGVTYLFRVRAEGPGGSSEWAGPVSVTPRDLPPTLVSYGAVVRLFGADRFATGVDASQKLWPDGADTVVLATGLDYPDALAGGPVAARHGAPLLLAATDHLPASVRDELVRLAPRRVILLGGAAALSTAVTEQVHALPSRPLVDRLAGAHRFATAERAAVEAGRTGTGDVVVATGEDYPDALSAGSLTAGESPVPVTLAVRGELVTELGSDERALLIGGPTVLTAEVEEQAAAQAGGVERLSGAHRFATSQAVADFALRHRLTEPPTFGRGWAFPPTLVVATGQNYPDALSAAAIAARTGGPVLLIPTDGPTPEQADWITANRDRFTGAIVVGGPSAVTDDAVRQLRNLLRPS